MILSVKKIQSDDFLTKFDTVDSDLISSRDFIRNFGEAEDYVEAHVYANDNDLLFSDTNYIGFKLPDVVNGGEKATVNSIIFDPPQHLQDLGFTNGKFIISYNIFRQKVFNSAIKPFFIKEISSDRTEVRLGSNIVSSSDIESGVLNFISEIQNSPYYRDFLLNFGDNNIVNAVNIALDKSGTNYTILVKLYKPLDAQFDINSSLWIVEELGESSSFEVELVPDVEVEPIQYIRSANFAVEYGKEDNISSDYFTINNLLSNSSLTAYQQILNAINNKNVRINVDYSDYSNFIHFSSAKERLLNFVYKLELIEAYQSDIDALETITNNQSSYSVSSSILNVQSQINNIISKFDGYESYLYYTSESNSWPKSNSTPPYTLYAVTSSQATTWLGSYDSNSPNYGGMMYTASAYDMENLNNLNFSTPEFINIDDQNESYQLFLNMVGQHFDNIWLYIKAISDTYDSKNAVNKGVSRDLVYQVLKGLGIKLYNASGNDNIFDYLVGISDSGSYTPVSESGQYLVTSSAQNVSGIDYNTEIFKRIYHNVSYLLKSKGTNRGLKTLITTYGIPSTILDVVDYGGADKEALTVEYSFDRFTYALQNENGSYLTLPWAPLTSNFVKYGVFDRVADSIEMRFKPDIDNINNTSVLIADAWNTSPVETRFAVWMEYTSSNTIPSAIVKFAISGTAGYNIASFVAPVYTTASAGEAYWWNLMIKREESLNRNQVGSDQTYHLYLKNVIGDAIGHQYSSSIFVEGAVSSSYNVSWSDFGTTGSNTNLYFGGVNFNSSYFGTSSYFNGNIQEIRLWSEPLTEDVFDLHVLNPESIQGNNTGSSYDSLSARFPLGNNLLTYNHSLTSSVVSTHPNQNIPISSGSLIAGSLYGSGLYGTAVYGDSGSGTFGYNTNISGASAVGFANEINYISFVEEYNLVSPNAGYYSPVTNKIRITDSTITGSVLSPDLSFEEIPYRTKDIHFTDVSFSPTNEIDKDFIATFGSTINLDDIIGDPRNQLSGSYTDLDNLKVQYYQKFERKYNYQDYIRLINFFDGSLFKMIKDFVPARTNIQTGVTIKSPIIERNKIKRFNPDVTNDYNYFTSSIEIGSISADSDHTSSIGDLRDFFTGELSGSMIDVLADFEQKNFNPYLQLTESIDMEKFRLSDFNVLLSNVSHSRESAVSRYVDYGTSSMSYPAEIQDYYKTYKRHANPRYEGSRITSAVINDYTEGDISYDKTSNVNINVRKFAWINKVAEKNLNFYDKTSLNIKYLIDSASVIYELDRTNRNLFEVQNTFKKGTYAGISLFNAYEPTIQTSLEGTKLIWEGGFSYSPIVYRETNEALRFNFIDPQLTYATNIGAKGVITDELVWYTIGNTDRTFANSLPVSPPNAFFTKNGVSQIGKFSLTSGLPSSWMYDAVAPFTFTGNIQKYNGTEYVVETRKTNWYAMDHILPQSTNPVDGGYATAEFTTAFSVVSNTTEKYVMFTSPKNTSYNVYISVPFEFNAIQRVDGASTFKIYAILEKNAGSYWQYIDRSTLEIVDLPTTNKVGINEANSFVYIDTPTGDDSLFPNSLKFNCVLTREGANAVQLATGEQLRVRFYLLDVYRIFGNTEYMTFTVNLGSAGNGYFNVIDAENSQTSLVTEYVISDEEFFFPDTGSMITDPNPYRLLFGESASIAYNTTIFTNSGSTISDYYSDITDIFTIQAGDIIRFGSFFTRNPRYYNIIGVSPPVVEYNAGVPTVIESLIVRTQEPMNAAEVTDNQFVILRKKPDETSIILDYAKTEGATSKGIIIPDAILEPIEEDVPNIVRPIREALIAGSNG